MNTKDTPIDYKQFEGHTPEKQAEHYQLYDAIWKIPNGKEFLITVNEGISENRNLKLELQKQKDSLFHHYGVVLKQQEEIQRFELERTEMYHKYEKQKELNAELVKTAIDEFIKLDYRSYTLAEIKLVLYSLIKKSNEI